MPPKKASSLSVPKAPARAAKGKKDEQPEEKSDKAKSQPKAMKQMTLTNGPLKEEPKKAKTKKFSGEPPATTTNSVGRWKTGDGEVPKNLTISSWNVNGIRSVWSKADLQNYVKKLSPEIICINETKIDEKAYDSVGINFDNYHPYWNFCKSAAGYSGVAVFSKHLPISIVEDIPGHPQHSQEGRVLTLQFKPFFLVTSYIPNAGQNLVRLDYRVKQWDLVFQQYLNELNKKKPVVWCGDLNVSHREIDIANPKSNLKSAGFTKEERESFDKFLGAGWVDTFRALHPTEVKYSYWSMRTGGRAKNVGWRLDYFVVPEPFFKKHVKDSRINNDIMGSDHCPVELDLTL